MAPKYFPHFIVKMQTKYWLFLYQKEKKMKHERRELHWRWSRSLDGLSRRSVPSSHARRQRFKPWSRQYLLIRRSLSWFGLASTPAESLPNLNPAFLLSASRPFNRWPSVWFGSMLCGTACDSTDSREISNDGNPSHPPPLHFLPTFFTRWRPSWVPLAAWNAIYQLLHPT